MIKKDLEQRIERLKEDSNFMQSFIDEKLINISQNSIQNTKSYLSSIRNSNPNLQVYQ